MIHSSKPQHQVDIHVHCQHDERPEGADELHDRKLVVELRDARGDEARDRAWFGKAVLTFALDALIFVCVTRLAECGVLSNMIAGGLIGSLIGARLYAARVRAIGHSLGASTVGALVLGVASLFSLRALRS